jgi:polyphosphate kinase
MLAATHSAHAPWVCVATDDKKKARKAATRYLLHAVAPPAWAATVEAPSEKVLFPYEPGAAERLAD